RAAAARASRPAGAASADRLAHHPHRAVGQGLRGRAPPRYHPDGQRAALRRRAHAHLRQPRSRAGRTHRPCAGRRGVPRELRAEEMSGALTVERQDELAILTLDNPAKRNALDPPMLDALCDALAHLPSQGARAVVLTGKGDRAFSSGFDLTALSDEAAIANNPLARALAAIAQGALPVIAALNGLAIGGGCELAATCDLRVAHPQVTLAMPPVRLGIVYSPSGLQRFVSLIGASRVRELFLTAQPGSAERALGWGL